MPVGTPGPTLAMVIEVSGIQDENRALAPGVLKAGANSE
jgi:hypothetical protein